MATHSLPGLLLTDHEFQVPLDHDQPEGETLGLFAREVRASDSADERLPWLLFLQGGPGHEAPRPLNRSGWLGRALEDFRVLLLDQRGTGRSSAVTYESLPERGDAQAQADYLAHFRADSIVRDAEFIRRELKAEPWTVLGQSYGGFCSVHYLSSAPEGLAGALITGGLPPLDARCEDVYKRTYPIVRRRNQDYYRRYPGDIDIIRDVAAAAEKDEVLLPGGDRLTARRLQMLGLHFGFSDGFEVVHYLFERAFVPGTQRISHAFLKGVEHALTYDTNPIFSLLHEACYTQGTASNWAAERVRSKFPEFGTDVDGPLYFTGEMIYPWMFDELSTLAPLREVAEQLAAREDWPALYDADALANNSVPAAAAIYSNDMYVEREYSQETAAAIQGMRTWVTAEHEHNALRADGRAVLDRLLGLLAPQ